MANEQGRYGSPTRETTTNPLSPKLGVFNAPTPIQGGGAGGVAGYDTSHIGDSQRAIASLLGQASTIYSDYLEKKKDQWELEGKLAYAQGKTEDEIRATGNKYTLGGFMTMNVRTSANEFAASMREQIATTDKMKSPDEFRTSLSKGYAELSDKVGSSNDPFVKQLLAASAEDTMPKLVAEQTLAHNTWKENETFSSYNKMLFSEVTKPGVTPEHIRDILNPEMSQLSPERHREAVITALKEANDSKDFRMRDAISGMDVYKEITSKDLPPTEQVKAQAMSLVAEIEGGFVPNDGGKGPTLYGVNSDANPEEYKLMKAAYDAGDTADARAIAKDTFSKKYWDEIGADSLPADMAIIAFDGAVNQGAPWMKKTLAEIAKTGGGAKELLAARRAHYIEIAQNDPTKAQFLQPWLERLNKLNTDSNTATPLSTSIDGMVSESSMIKQLVANGYTAAQIETAVSSSRRAEQAISTDFNKTRILTEESLEATAKAEGNLPARLDDIARVKAQNGYSDDWAKSMATRATNAVEAYNKEHNNLLSVRNASANGDLSGLSSANQKLAIETHRQEVAASIAAMPDLTEDQQNELITRTHGKWLADTDMVDPMMAGQMSAAINGSSIGPDGKLSKKAIDAYRDYRILATIRSPAYASRYLDDQAKPIIAMAETYDESMNSDSALVAAYQQMSRKSNDTNFASKRAGVEDVRTAVREIFNERDPGFWSPISPYQAADTYDITDFDIIRAKNSPVAQSVVAAAAQSELDADSTGNLTVKGAVKLARMRTEGRLELMPYGNVVASSRYSTIREDMGFPLANAENVPFKMVQNYLKYNGKVMFGSQYTGVSHEAEKQYAAYAAREKKAGREVQYKPGDDPRSLYGMVEDAVTQTVPMSITYDPDRKAYIFDLLHEVGGDMVPMKNPQTVPARTIGEFHKMQKFTERSHSGMSDAYKDYLRTVKEIPESKRGVPTLRAGF